MRTQNRKFREIDVINFEEVELFQKFCINWRQSLIFQAITRKLVTEKALGTTIGLLYVKRGTLLFKEISKYETTNVRAKLENPD